jgi:tRNA(Ile2) C34 agmatinyltransferase TiaS
MAIFLIGIDDTDNETSPGTGKLARELGREIEGRGAKLLGVTRHQFLVDDRIARASQNRGACLAIEMTDALDVLEAAIDFIAESSAKDSDPGICIAALDEVPSSVMDWGWTATREVLGRDRAFALAKACGICLRMLGDNGYGVIGALASVGLRADGNEGWFHDLPGLRTLGDVADYRQLTDLGIEVDHHLPNPAVASDPAVCTGEGAIYKTQNWVRPRLVKGRPVWPVEWSNNERAWIGIDRKKSRPLE